MSGDREISARASTKKLDGFEDIAMDQRECSTCGRKVRGEENYLKAHLWADTAVFHWQCLVALMKERGDLAVEGATCRTARGSSVRK